MSDLIAQACPQTSQSLAAAKDMICYQKEGMWYCTKCRQPVFDHEDATVKAARLHPQTEGLEIIRHILTQQCPCKPHFGGQNVPYNWVLFSYVRVYVRECDGGNAAPSVRRIDELGSSLSGGSAEGKVRTTWAQARPVTNVLAVSAKFACPMCRGTHDFRDWTPPACYRLDTKIFVAVGKHVQATLLNATGLLLQQCCALRTAESSAEEVCGDLSACIQEGMKNMQFRAVVVANTDHEYEASFSDDPRGIMWSATVACKELQPIRNKDPSQNQPPGDHDSQGPTKPQPPNSKGGGQGGGKHQPPQQAHKKKAQNQGTKSTKLVLTTEALLKHVEMLHPPRFVRIGDLKC